jgi:hypothetical protein
LGDPDGLAEPNPDAPKGWEAVGDEPGTVTAELQTLIDAGVDSMVLVPLGKDAEQQLQLASTEVVPQLVR